jgi:CDP-glycerol glycerophosphotransferase
VPAVVYNSFHGRYSDNPRAIYEELARRTSGWTHYWTAAAPEAPALPPGATRTIPGTAKDARAVDSAKYVVANVEMRDRLRKRPGTTFLQTWHGTALKRIGYDNR